MNYDTDIQDKIFEFCYMNALRDATLQGAFLGKLEDITNGEEGKKLKKQVREYADLLVKSDSTLKDDKYIYDLIDSVTKDAPCSYDKNNRIVYFTYGNAQKLVNMTAKYLYIRAFSSSESVGRFKCCHCPMDSIIIKAMKKDVSINSELDAKIEKEFNKINEKGKTTTWRKYLDLSWSSCTKERYGFFQKIIKEVINEKYKNEISPLEYDFLKWKPNRK